MPRRPRGLRPEDADLWHRVTRSIAPMHPARPRLIAEPEPAPAKPAPRPIAPFQIGAAGSASRDHVLMPALADQLGMAPVQMDAKAFHRMSRGKLAPEARIDLHGMTLAEAHPDLNQFILRAHRAGLRLVLVITGKGRRGDDAGPIPQRHGVLKHQVPQWLRMAPLAPLILQVAEAHLKHGGAGAYYVYLRRGR